MDPVVRRLDLATQWSTLRWRVSRAPVTAPASRKTLTTTPIAREEDNLVDVGTVRVCMSGHCCRRTAHRRLLRVANARPQTRPTKLFCEAPSGPPPAGQTQHRQARSEPKRAARFAAAGSPAQRCAPTAGRVGGVADSMMHRADACKCHTMVVYFCMLLLRACPAMEPTVQNSKRGQTWLRLANRALVAGSSSKTWV